MPARKYKNVPTVEELYLPVLKALKVLDGSANIEELNQKVYELMKLSETVLSVPHGDDGRSKVEYRLAWSRTRLKFAGYLENSSRAVWSLINPKLNVESITNQQIIKSLKRNRLQTMRIIKLNLKSMYPQLKKCWEKHFLIGNRSY